MKDAKLHGILARRLGGSSLAADDLLDALLAEGYVIVSKEHLADAIQSASRKIAEAFVMMVPPPEKPQ